MTSEEMTKLLTEAREWTWEPDLRVRLPFLRAHLRNVIAGLRERITKVDAENSRLRDENARLRKAILNQAGDDLCWLETGWKTNLIPPCAEFLESCSRFHAQISGQRGELTGCMTIAQLEAEVARLREQLTGTAGIDKNAGTGE